MKSPVFTAKHEDLVLKLLEWNTINPLESGECSQLPEAQACFSNFAQERGFTEILCRPAPSSVLNAPATPLTITEKARQMGEKFLRYQPNLVLRYGRERPTERTLAFNFHMDTVNGWRQPSFDGTTFRGLGAIDNKAPGVAILAGIELAARRNHGIQRDLQVLVQSVAGEEGGAIGWLGTKVLAKDFSGRLNVVAEPSEGYFFDASTTSMTARVEVTGRGAHDDSPGAGHNATLILAVMALEIAEAGAALSSLGAKLCVAGSHTGLMHNRVYGTGSLLVNIAYPDLSVGEAAARMIEQSYARALEKLRKKFAGDPFAGLTGAEADDVTRLTWIKRGLPVLRNQDAGLARLMTMAGWRRLPRTRQERAFTCDAMWLQRPGSYAVVCGPGSLSENGAHTEAENVSLADLERYSRGVADLVQVFWEQTHGRNNT